MSELRIDWTSLCERGKEVYRDYLAPVVFEEGGERRTEMIMQKANCKRFWLASGKRFAIPGILRTWSAHGGGLIFTMTMITINTDEHPLLRQLRRHFDKKGDREETHSLVIIRPGDYDSWFGIKDPDEVRQFFSLLPAAELCAELAPKPSKKRGSETA